MPTLDRRTQAGQSLVVALALVAALAAAWLYAFDAGRLANQKQRLTNAADLAAYGAAVWQARALNFEAYMNRAMLANEAAIAQAVSLRSWADYLERTLANARTVTAYVPYLGTATAALESGWGRFNVALQGGMVAAETAASAVNVVLSAAQRAVHAAGFAAATEVAAATLRATDPAMRASAAQPALGAAASAAWLAHTATWDGPRRARHKAVVLESLDGFTRERNHRFPLGPAGALVRIDKRGGTELLGFEAWRGVDTQAVHLRSGLIFGRWRERIPVGWGAAEGGRAASWLRGWHGGSYAVNGRTSRLAELAIRRHDGYRGLQPTRDVADPRATDARGPWFAVEAELAHAALGTADSALGIREVAPTDGARVSRRTRLHGERMTALAAAEVHFRRPVGRWDARREAPSLYAPYWQARLVAPDRRQRLLAAAAHGLVDPWLLVD